MGSLGRTGRSHLIRAPPQVDQGIERESRLGFFRVFLRSLTGPTLRENSVHLLLALRALPLFHCLGWSLEIIGQDLAGPNEVLVIQDTNVRKHVGNRDLGNVRPRPVAKDGLNAFAFEELVHQPDFCGVPISKNFVHNKARKALSAFAGHQIPTLQLDGIKTVFFG